MITLTDSAASHIREIFSSKQLEETSAVRFRVKSGGCSGFSYSVETESSSNWELPKASDETFISKDVRVIVDKKSLQFISNTLVDYKSDSFTGRFIFTNPNSGGGCGCGISFTPKI